MANYYVDHGAYATNIGATPTWGVPQEGDGSTKDAATTSSVASIAFASVPTSGTFSVCGVTITLTNVLSQADVDTSANNLASSINAMSTTVASNVAVGTPQLRNLVYARGPSGGAPAGTCQIMMRVGSTTLNYVTNANAAIASTFNGSPTLTQFTGGSGGCWGWLINPSAIGVSSSIAVRSYGIMFFNPMAWTAQPGATDIVWARTGSGKTITMNNGGSSLTISRTSTWALRLVFDSNTVWTGDSGTGQVLLDLVTTANYLTTSINPCAANSDVAWIAKYRGGLKVKYTYTGSGSATLFSNANGSSASSYLGEGIVIEDATTDTTAPGLYFGAQNGYNNYSFVLRGCDFTRTVSSSTLKPLVRVLSVSNTNLNYLFEGCTFTWNISGVVDPGPIVSIDTLTTAFINFNGCSFSGWSGGQNRFKLAANTTAQTNCKIVAENCSGLGYAYAGFNAATDRVAAINAAGLWINSATLDGMFRHESRAYVVEYNPNDTTAFPTLNSYRLDGSQWSIRFLWFNNGEVNTAGIEARLPPLELVYAGAAATATLSVHLFMRTALFSALDWSKIAMTVSYVIDTTGALATETKRVVPVASGSTWTNAGLYSGYSGYKLDFATAYAIAQNSRVKVSLVFDGSPGTGQNENIYIDPEFGIA